MITPAIETAFENSWPAAEYAQAGPFRIGRGKGGGMRVSSARPLSAGWSAADISEAARIQDAWEQTAAFRVTDGDPLGGVLAAQGWRIHSPTLMMTAPLDVLTDRAVPPVTAFSLWPPLAIQRELWTASGISPARQAVMTRVALPRRAILGRCDDRAGGVAFVAAAGETAVLHALEVVPALRRRGLAGWMMREAAIWAQRQGCHEMLLAVTAANAPAVALYRGFGFTGIGRYSYFLR
ncbi:MAG: GNAT family N-acetyltransferase [Paracoccus sp. (in: a-proteobacteria)]|nr:GNAT family N-acetyltransferase [Paracoccus sp. (in: a-proteobacteria)]